MNITPLNYPKFRSETMSLHEDLTIMLGKMDEVVSSESLPASLKEIALSALVKEYL